MTSASVPAGAAHTAALGAAPPAHSAAFRTRRFFNWFPLGLTYAFLYMGRYNLNVAKNALGDLMTKEDFGKVFSAGALVYALAILINGPLVDRIGGKRGILIAASGACAMNLLMGLYLHHTITSGTASGAELRLVFSLLYAGNMYFQSYGAVAIVKVNAHWFHVRERGGFSGVFGTMISSGLFLAYTVNGWVLDAFSRGASGVARSLAAEWVFFLPAGLLGLMAVTELAVLRDRPSLAGFKDFDTGDASSDDDDASTLTLMKRVLTNPVILTIAFIELCTGVLRNGVMQWYPIFVKEVESLPSKHPLNNGSWGSWITIVPFFVASAALFALGSRVKQRRVLFALGGVAFLAPFLQGGWGGILMVAGVIGGNLAGWVSDLFFGSRRAPAAAGLYALLLVCCVAMVFVLGRATAEVASSSTSGLLPNDRVVAVAGHPVSDWVGVKRAFACSPAACAGDAGWDAERCLCAGGALVVAAPSPLSRPTIPVDVERGGERVTVAVTDPAYAITDGSARPRLRAGDGRELPAAPVLSLSPYLLGVVVFLMSLSVIGTHGLLSGTATMDFGGRKGAGTAVAMIDGFVYLGSSLQSFALGQLTSKSWSYWPWFLLPFAGAGLLLARRIWDAKPTRVPAH